MARHASTRTMAALTALLIVVLMLTAGSTVETGVFVPSRLYPAPVHHLAP